MTLKEVWDKAREVMAPQCRACPVCNGVACRGEVPGVGAVGDGAAWTVCTEFLNRVKINMDTVYEYRGIDTSLSMFGHGFKYPIFIAPIGGMGGHNYNSYMDLYEYSMTIVEGGNAAGILPFTGGGNVEDQFLAGLKAAKAYKGMNAVISKPFRNEKLLSYIPAIKDAGCIAWGCDIDAAGFANMPGMIDSVLPKSVAEIRELVDALDIPFILKGVMTAKGAEKAVEAGCAAIVVSSHGGRVLASAPATCEVLPEIKAAVGDSIKIIVDGGIRSGADIFKALALGADVAMIGRPFIVAAMGGRAQGVKLYADKLGAELRNIMQLTGAAKLSDIDSSMIRY
jgi:4-hydroxymandelate oxidase